MPTIAAWMPDALPSLAPARTQQPSAPKVARSKLVMDVQALARRGQELDAAAHQAEKNRYITAIQKAFRSREPDAISDVAPFDTTPTPALDQLIDHATDVRELLRAFAAGDPALTAQIEGYLDAFSTQLAPRGQEPGRSDPRTADRLWELARAATQFMLLHTLAG